MPLVKLDHAELWWYYDEWSGYGVPDVEEIIPDELWNKYKKCLSDFFEVLEEMKIAVKDD